VGAHVGGADQGGYRNQKFEIVTNPKPAIAWRTSAGQVTRDVLQIFFQRSF